MLALTRLVALAALVFACALACTDSTKLVEGCKQDSDCGDPQSFRCDVEKAECLCKSDAACKDGEHCNAQGYCQAQVGCYANVDCPVGYFCDNGTNTCIPNGRCTTDVQCALGTLCDSATSTCKPGCRSHGDCKLGESCVCTRKLSDGSTGEVACSCPGVTASDRAACAVGVCKSGQCGDKSFCAFGEVCRVPPEGGPPQCLNDYDPVARPYCDNCVYSPGKDTCGQGPNFCLISTYTRTTFCGVDCSEGQECPNGYSCKDVRVVYGRSACGTDDDCAAPDKRTDIPCATDADCKNHGLCGKAPGATTGFCHGRCFIREGAVQGFCSCIVDDDCFQDSCDVTTRTCSVTRKPCNLTEDCRRIRCVDAGGQGACLIGQNCSPVEGLTCQDVRNTQ